MPDEHTTGTRIGMLRSLYPEAKALVLTPGAQTGMFNGEAVLYHPGIAAGSFTSIPGRGNSIILAGDADEIEALVAAGAKSEGRGM